jgi:predicted transcriptional regulator
MGWTSYQISRLSPDSTAISSSSDISEPSDIPTIQDMLSAISDDKSLAIFGIIAEQDNIGADSHIICMNLHLTRKEYYYRLAALVRIGLIIRKDGNKNYILTSLGKVVFNSLLAIRYTLDNMWKFRAIDAVRISENTECEVIDKIASGLVDTLVHEEKIREILKK